MACEFRYQHIRNTNPGEAPSSSYIREGEIAVNIAADNERIFLKNTDNEIVSFIPEEEVNKRIDNHTFKSSAITDFVESVENVVNSSTTITNRIKNVVTSAITNDSSVSGAVKSIVSAYTYDKNTIDTKIATHTHASSAVTSMANYSKASAAAAITTGDSLNVAIGKLEKGIEAAAAGGVSSASLGSGSTNGVVTLTVNGTLQDTIYVPGLKGAAFLETGTTTSTVARGKHSHTASEITDFNEAVSGAVKNNTDVKNEIISAVTSSTAFTTLSGDVYTISGDVVTLSGNVTTISGDLITISGDVVRISGDVVTISGDVNTISGVAYSAKAVTDFITGHNTVASLQNMPKDKRLVIATITASTNNFSVSDNTLPDGYEMHIIIKNNSNSKITVTFPSSGNYVAVVSSIDIAANGVGEANIISDGTKLYVRGA